MFELFLLIKLNSVYEFSIALGENTCRLYLPAVFAMFIFGKLKFEYNFLSPETAVLFLPVREFENLGSFIECSYLVVFG